MVHLSSFERIGRGELRRLLPLPAAAARWVKIGGVLCPGLESLPRLRVCVRREARLRRTMAAAM
eukprot:COSAG06_NODE_45275_length_356_cov_0.778210_1_plen_63_part_01